MKMNIFNTSQRLGDIVAIMPKASETFKEYHIDFCCGGARPLGDAIKEQKLNEKEILARLHKDYEETQKISAEVDFTNLSSSDLIDYIVNIHHAFLKKILPELSELTTKILSVHGTNHNELFSVHKLFHTLKMELEQHLIKEEGILFPLIKTYEESPAEVLLNKISTVMGETEDEHEAAGGVLKELRRVTEDYRIPEGVCGSFRLTYEKLQELEADLFQHIHLENNILFKRLGSSKFYEM